MTLCHHVQIRRKELKNWGAELWECASCGESVYVSLGDLAAQVARLTLQRRQSDRDIRELNDEIERLKEQCGGDEFDEPRE